MSSGDRPLESIKAACAEQRGSKGSAGHHGPAVGAFLLAGLLGLAATYLSPTVAPGPLATWPGLLALGDLSAEGLGRSLLGGASELTGFVLSASILATGLFWKNDGAQGGPSGEEGLESEERLEGQKGPQGEEAPAVAELGAGGKGPSTSPTSGRLSRSTSSSRILGVCGGLGEYLNIDPVPVRVVFMAGTIVLGVPFVLAYLGFAYAMPKERRSVT